MRWRQVSPPRPVAPIRKWLWGGEREARNAVVGSPFNERAEEIAVVCSVDVADLGEIDHSDPEDVLRWAIQRFGDRLAIVTSFQADGMVILDLASRIDRRVRVLTIDSGRLHQETYDLMERVRDQYRISIEVFYPDPAELEPFIQREGINSFYRDVSLRLRCCEIRKVKPLQRALRGFDAWVTGIRRDQAATRTNIHTITIDHEHGNILKISPLASWTDREVWDYIHNHDVPYSALYQRGYTSIGCAPCTRPVAPGQGPRAGRWWWEKDMPKECGIHRGVRLEV